MKKSTKIKIIKLIILVSLVLLITGLTIYFLPILKNLNTQEGQLQFKEKVNQSKILGFLILLGLEIAQIILAVLPGEPVEVLAGICFGTFWGTIFLMFSIFITTVLIYVLVKKNGKKFICEFFSKEQVEVLNLVNKERKANGLKPLTLNKELSNVANIKSRDMIEKGYFDHTSPTYGSPFDMMKKFNISYNTAGENIAMGQKTPSEVMNSWMNSSGHRANILNSTYTELGVGIQKDSNGTIYWTQMFIGR